MKSRLRTHSASVAGVATALACMATPAAGDLNRQDGVPNAPVVTSPAGWVGLTVEFIAHGAQQAEDGQYTVVVGGVEPGGPAWEAGVSAGDTLMSINGAPASPSSFAALRNELRVGDALELALRRIDAREVQVIAAPRPFARVGSVPARLEVRIDSLRSTILRNADALRGSEGRVVSINTFTAEADSFITVLDVGDGQHVGTARGNVRIRTRDGGSVVQAWAFTFEQPGTPRAIETMVVQSPKIDSVRLVIQGLKGELDLARRAELRRQRQLVERTETDEHRIDRDDRVLVELRAMQRILSDDLQRAEEALKAVSRAELDTPAPVTAVTPPSPPVEWVEDETPRGRVFTPDLVGKNYLGGAQVTEMNEGLSAYFEADSGVLITEVAPWSVAAESGLESGDVIIGVDGHMIHSVRALRERLTHHWDGAVLSLIRKGDSVQVVLER